MGQHASTESGTRGSDRLNNIPSASYHRRGNASQADVPISEDETMADVPSTSSTSSLTTTSMTARRRASSLTQHPQPPTNNRTTGLPRRRTSTFMSSNSTPAASASTSSRNRGRPSLWCRVQSLRNRIYRTTRRINFINHSETTNGLSTRVRTATGSGSHSSRRNALGDSIARPSRPRSGIFGPVSQPPAPPSRPRPLSFADFNDIALSDWDFSTPLPPSAESDSRRPRTSHSQQTADNPGTRSTSHPRRSIWSAVSSSSTSPSSSTSRPVTSSAATTPTSSSVLDHSAAAPATLNHPVHPFNITRRPGEDQAEMLSRFLYVAGAALAASLVGSTDSSSTSTSQLWDFSGDISDAMEEQLANAPEGSFEGFLRALRQGRSQFAHALRSDSDSPSDAGESGSRFTYLLMYRFNSLNSSAGSHSSTMQRTNRADTMMDMDSMTTTADEEPSSASSDSRSTSSSPSEPRMVPFVIIGVQPVSPRDPNQTTVPSFSEGVASLLANARQNTSTNHTPSPSLRPTTSSGSMTSDVNSLRSTTSVPSTTTLPGSWREAPPSQAPAESLRRRASFDGAFRPLQPNNSTQTTNQTRVDRENTRAWQMYIYGGQYPENHLIFTAPTLFTDVPCPINLFFILF